MEQKQKAWKEKYITFQEKEVRNKTIVSILGVLFGGFLLALPIGAALTLTYGGIPPTRIAIRLSDAILGGWCILMGVLFIVCGISGAFNNLKELRRLDKLKSEA